MRAIIIVAAIIAGSLLAQLPKPGGGGVGPAGPSGPSGPSGTTGSIIMGNCIGAVTNLATIVLAQFQGVSASCNSTTGQQGAPVRAATIRNLRVAAATASATAGSGVVAIYKNSVAQSVTCTLGITAACQDLSNNFTTASNDFLTVKVRSTGGTITTGPTYASGASACTNGTQTVTFSNNTSGTNATGTITVSGNVPTGAATITGAGTGYAAATPPTQGTVATCTGTAVFTGGTVTVDTLAGVVMTFEVF